MNPSSSLFNSQSLFFVISTIQADKPEVCIEVIQRLSCLLTSPPCDRESDLPLKICEDSCEAYDTLISSATCNSTKEAVIKDLGNVSSFSAVKQLFLQDFNCSDTSTYFLGTETEFSSDSCTELFPDNLKGLPL